jgi:hypothetical protein
MKLATTLLPLVLPLMVVQPSACAQSTYGQRIVAAVIAGEALSEGEIGMTAVAEVIRNRAKDAHRTPLEIVLKHGEFACLHRRTPQQLYDRFARRPGYQVALRLARTCYNEPDRLPNLTHGARFFDRKRDRPWWFSQVRLVACIGNHNFYVLKD